MALLGNCQREWWRGEDHVAPFHISRHGGQVHVGGSSLPKPPPSAQRYSILSGKEWCHAYFKIASSDTCQSHYKHFQKKQAARGREFFNVSHSKIRMKENFYGVGWNCSFLYSSHLICISSHDIENDGLFLRLQTRKKSSSALFPIVI